MNKKVTSFVLLGLMATGLSTNTQCANAKDICKKLKTPALVVTSVLVGAGIFRFFEKRSSKSPLSRFDKEKMKPALKNGDYKEFLNQVWYFIDDIIIGQAFKKASVKVVKEGEKLDLDVDEGCPPSGIMGHTHAKLYPLGKAIGFIIVLEEFIKNTMKGLTKFGKFIEEPFSVFSPEKDKPSK